MNQDRFQNQQDYKAKQNGQETGREYITFLIILVQSKADDSVYNAAETNGSRKLPTAPSGRPFRTGLRKALWCKAATIKRPAPLN